jgi:YggT family protein
MASIAHSLAAAANLYILILIVRLVLEYVAVFARDWRPKGALLMLSEFVFTVTDPPLKLIRRVVPMLRLGTVSLDLSFVVLLIGIQIIRNILASV